MTLPTKETISNIQQFLNPDGTFKKGTQIGNIHYNIVAQECNKAYNEGIKFVLEDMTKRLKPLAYLNFNEEFNFIDLPPYASELSDIIKVLENYTLNLRYQLNNNNSGKTSFKEGTKKLIAQAERIMKLKKGTLISIMKGDSPRLPSLKRVKNISVEEEEEDLTENNIEE